jgi:hypothetical protein
MQKTDRILRILAALAFSLATGAEAVAGPAADSRSSLSRDEQAVYSAVLEAWLGSEHGMQRLNQRLGPRPSLSGNAECANGAHFVEPYGDAPVEKTLDASNFHAANIVLVDGEAWRPDDPAQGMTQGKPVGAAVDEAISRSLISLSQIAFSADGRDALVSFSMSCGRLCGTRFTLRMHRSRDQWKVAKRCSGYIS